MCLNLHPDFIITDCVFHYCFGIIGPGDMHLKNYNIQIYTVLFNQQKSMKINTYKYVFIQATKTQFAFIHHSKGEILWKKNPSEIIIGSYFWDNFWYMIFFFRSQILLQKTFIAYQANFFFFCFKKGIIIHVNCLVILDVISIMRMR